VQRVDEEGLGAAAFVMEVQERLERRRTAMTEAGGAWTLRETPADTAPIFD
jgi:hypothetical protein